MRRHTQPGGMGTKHDLHDLHDMTCSLLNYTTHAL